MPGRAASSRRSDLLRPVILASTAEKPEERPGIWSWLSVISPRRSSTSGSTRLMGTMSWALWPRRTAKIFCSAASRVSDAVPMPSWTMAVISEAAMATPRSRALSRTIFTYSMTLAEVGVISISSARYRRVVCSS